MATKVVNKRAAAADENIETITPAESVGRTRFDPSAISFDSSEVVEKTVASRGARFGEDHPLFIDYKSSYEAEEPHKLTTADPAGLVKGLRKLAGQLELGVRILEQDAGSVTYLATEKRTRRTQEELAVAAGTDAAEIDAEA